MQKEVAIPASIAFPPLKSTLRPISEHNPLSEATAVLENVACKEFGDCGGQSSSVKSFKDFFKFSDEFKDDEDEEEE
uniref:Uncharacterized protein n=1 Tax=Panagrolaimus superbus TaxID=310955 RepID=A0A914YNP3_9BILA